MLTEEIKNAIDAANASLRFNLTLAVANQSDSRDGEISQAYQNLLGLLVTDYECYRYGVGTTLATLESMDITSFSHSIVLYINTLYPALRKPFNPRTIHDVLNVARTNDGVERMMGLFHDCLKNGVVNLSGPVLNVSRLTIDELRELVSILVYHIQEDCQRTKEWDTTAVNSLLVLLYILRSACSSIRDTEVFYHVSSTFIETLTRKSHNQLARDLTEEVLLASYNDSVSFMGLFCAFKTYSNQHSAQTTYLYGNLYIKALEALPYIPSKKYVYEIIWQSMRAFRNTDIQSQTIELYRAIPPGYSFTLWEQQSLDNTYFNCLLSEQNKSIVPELSDYLNREREVILGEGDLACLSWFIILMNLKKMDDHFGYSKSGLDCYYHLFNGIVKDPIAVKYGTMFFGTTAERTDLLKVILLKTRATRDRTDFAYDLNEPIKMANYLLESSFPEGNVESTLIASMLKTDYTFSLSVITKEQSVTPVVVDSFEPDSFYQHYPRLTDTIQQLPLSETDAIVWLLSSGVALNQLVYFKGEFIFNTLEPWSEIQYRRTKKDFLLGMNFDTGVKDRFGSRTYLPEDYEEQAEKIAMEFYFPKLILPGGATRVLLVKDVEISETPHNLLQSNAGFVSVSTQVCNIYSVEWLRKILLQQSSPSWSDVKAYIPTEAGDLTLEMLYSLLEPCFTTFSVGVQTSAKKVQPLSATINIMAMHGDADIAKTNLLFQDQESFLVNSRQVIGRGRILVLLVCYSGSAAEAFQRFEVASFVKPYLISGYDAVVAPCWSLHINIPPIWLPVFLNTLRDGDNVSTAVHKANLAVHQEYPTPSAWACMHLYGNPYFRSNSSAA